MRYYKSGEKSRFELNSVQFQKIFNAQNCSGKLLIRQTFGQVNFYRIWPHVIPRREIFFSWDAFFKNINLGKNWFRLFVLRNHVQFSIHTVNINRRAVKNFRKNLKISLDFQKLGFRTRHWVIFVRKFQCRVKYPNRIFQNFTPSSCRISLRYVFSHLRSHAAI